MILRLVLFVSAALLELGGLALVIVGVRADRHRAAELLALVDGLNPLDGYERMMRVGLGGAPMNAQLAVDLHRQQISLHAGELANAGRRQTYGVVLFAGGTLLGLVANVISL